MVFSDIEFCRYEKQNIKWMQFHAHELKQKARCSDSEHIFVIFIFYKMRMEKEYTLFCDCNDNPI